MLTECCTHTSRRMDIQNKKAVLAAIYQLENSAYEMAERADKLADAFSNAVGEEVNWNHDLDFDGLANYLCDLHEVSKRNAEVLGKFSSLVLNGRPLREAR